MRPFNALALLAAVFLVNAGSAYAAASTKTSVPNFTVPILMYHYIQDMPATGRVVRDLTVTPGTFAAQLQILSKKGYQTVSFAMLASAARPADPGSVRV